MQSTQLNIFVIFNCLKNYCTLKGNWLRICSLSADKVVAFLKSKAHLVGNNLGGRRLLFMVIFNVIFSRTELKGKCHNVCKIPTILEGSQNRLPIIFSFR